MRGHSMRKTAITLPVSSMLLEKPCGMAVSRAVTLTPAAHLWVDISRAIVLLRKRTLHGLPIPATSLT